MYVCTYVRTYVYTYVCMYVRTYVRTYIRMYVCMYVRTYIHTYVHTYVLFIINYTVSATPTDLTLTRLATGLAHVQLSWSGSSSIRYSIFLVVVIIFRVREPPRINKQK